jgi:hypothetical protein
VNGVAPEARCSGNGPLSGWNRRSDTHPSTWANGPMRPIPPILRVLYGAVVAVATFVFGQLLPSNQPVQIGSIWRLATQFECDPVERQSRDVIGDSTRYFRGVKNESARLLRSNCVPADCGIKFSGWPTSQSLSACPRREAHHVRLTRCSAQGSPF